jgi:transposase
LICSLTFTYVHSQWDFLEFLSAAIDDGQLRSGDVLVVDNASVHVGHETTDLVFDLLRSHNIFLLFLPAYSPELNPCELVFALLKDALRQMTLSPTMVKEILLVLARISSSQVAAFYKKCIWDVTQSLPPSSPTSESHPPVNSP